jgi:glycosyltransferase involved in cell wall biosynthesis
VSPPAREEAATRSESECREPLPPRALGLKVLIVSGIWPPDVGGPASHGPEFARFLLARDHAVRAVTSAGPDGAEAPGFPLAVSRRDRPRPIRLATGALAATRAARWADVVYSAGMYSRSTLAATINRLPLVMKLASDPAYERARRLGLFTGTLEAFQQPQGSRRLRYLKRFRTAMVSKASRIVIPSEYLAEIAQGWGISAEVISVVPNVAPPMDWLAPREALRQRFGLAGATFVFVGRLVPAKQLELALSALQHVPEASLVIVGDGPERGTVADEIAKAGLDDRVTLMGALPRAEAIEWLAAADAAVLSSAWENFPHAAVEALATGTPLLATAVGGVPEVIHTGVNGILVPPGGEHELAAAMRSVARDAELLSRLRRGAAASAGRYSAERAYAAIERALHDAASAGPAPGDLHRTRPFA